MDERICVLIRFYYLCAPKYSKLVSFLCSSVMKLAKTSYKLRLLDKNE